MSPAAAPSMEEKGRAIARCLGYRDLPAGQGAPSAIDAEPQCDAPSWLASGGAATGRVDLWRLRTLALQPGGLLNSHGRKLGWIKLAGVDALVFQPQYRSLSLSAPQDDDERCTHDEIRTYLAGEMAVSRWHVQRERKHLRQRAKKPRASSSASYASHASSSIGSASGSTTPLTANLHSNAGTPRSVTFAQGDEPSVRSASVGAPFSFMAFATTQSHRTETSSATSFASFPSVTVDTTFRGSTPTNAANKENHVNDREASPSSNEDTLLAPSPLSLPCSPGSANHAHFFAKDKAALPQDRAPLAQFHVDITPVKSFLEYSQRYQQRHKKKGLKPPRAKKDRRQQERKLLVQISTSAFYMLQCQMPGVDLQCYEGLQDLIAVLLLRMESPSATSLLLRQVLESHLWMHCIATDEDDAGSDDASFASCIEDEPEPREWDALSMSFFPLLQVVDGELHASLLEMADGQDFLEDRAFVFGEVLQKWISSWFCCHDVLPVEVVSRVVDFFLASHPSMPLYLSTAVLCHSIHREKLLAIAQQEAPVATVLDSLFSDLPQELGLGDEDELLADFMEQSICTAIAFMKQVPPKDLSSLTKGYQNSILLPCIKPGELESLASTSPWTSRSRAPTDYKMIERMFAGGTIGSLFRFPLLGVGVADQIALDASGLPADTLWKGKRRGVAVAIVAVVLVVLMGLMQPQYGSGGRMSVPFSGDGIQPIVPLPLNVKKTGPSNTGASAPPAEDDDIVSMRDAGAEDTSAARIFDPLSEMSSVVSLLGRDESGGKSLDADDDEPAPTGTTKKEPKRAALDEVGTKRSRAVALIKGRALSGVVGLRDGFIALVENDDFFL